MPYPFGSIVYHRAGVDKVPGMVTGYLFTERDYQVRICWGDDLREGLHHFFELTEEYTPVV